MRRAARSENASTLLVALLTTAGLSVIVGLSLLNITSRSQSAARSAAYNEAGIAADTAADLAVAEIRRVMPDFAKQRRDGWSGWTAELDLKVADLPLDKSLQAGLKLTLAAPSLMRTGEGGWQTSSATVDAPAGLTDASGRQWLRIRAVGTSIVPGWRGPSKNKLDNQLRGIAFLRDWRTGADVAQPQVSRWIEVIVQPLSAYNAAVACPGAINISHPNAVVDSFDSTSSAKSSSGIYDSTKRQENGSIYTNASELTFKGKVYGDVGTNGGSAPAGATISGTFSNVEARSFPPVTAPTWTTFNSLVSSVTSLLHVDFKIEATLNSALEKYKRTADLASELKIEGAVGSSVEVWIDGNITAASKIRVKPGVKAIIYFTGDLKLPASAIDNDTLRAGNLQLIGIQPEPGKNPVIEIDLDTDLYASIYAPGHAMTLTDKGSLIGSVVAKSLTATGKLQIHYDEALARLPQPIADYKVASWVEEVR